MAEEVLNLQLVSVQVDETDEVDGMRFSTFKELICYCKKN
ncbi:SapB/AmfS family lantipeptide [Streptococcus pneumoniae]|nr:SapB/AmfS family lantipeptide [Streptococcus pneumoniae]